MSGIDSHCHLDFEQFDEDREQVIESAKNKLEFIVNPGANPEHNKNAFELHEKYPDFVKFNVGLHPVYTEDFDKLEEVKNQVKQFDPCAIGEIGLDYHHVKDDEIRERQKNVFKELLALAEELDKPVVIHSRDAEEEAINIIEKFEIDRVFLHCFNGSVDLAMRAVENGWYIGITTQILYSERVKNIAESVPIENIVLETDAPYLYRKDRNEPLNILESASELSKIKDVDKKKILEMATSNSKNLFSS